MFELCQFLIKGTKYVGKLNRNERSPNKESVLTSVARKISNEITSEFEISGFDKCKTWLVDTRLKKNCQIMLPSLFQLHLFIQIIKSNPL